MFGCFVKLTLNALNAWEVWNLRHLCLAQENNVGLQDFSSFVELFFFILDLQQTLHVFQRYNSKGLLLL